MVEENDDDDGLQMNEWVSDEPKSILMDRKKMYTKKMRLVFFVYLGHVLNQACNPRITKEFILIFYTWCELFTAIRPENYMVENTRKLLFLRVAQPLK